MKGTVQNHLQKIAQPFKTVQFQVWKIAPSSKSLKKKKEKKTVNKDTFQWIELSEKRRIDPITFLEQR